MVVMSCEVMRSIKANKGSTCAWFACSPTALRGGSPKFGFIGEPLERGR
jgi:hypothetical protein